MNGIDSSAAPAGSVAVIGMSCRFPGASSLEQLWQNLAGGVESISFFSEDEARAEGVSEAILANPRYVRAGGILPDLESFDARFFGISAAEAELLDPQHRIFLECAWEAMENGGYPPEGLNVRVGVYGGASSLDYLRFNLRSALDPTQPNRYLQAWLGSDKDYLTTRVSYRLGLRGPSVAVQTACSTSLVAVVLACQSLLSYQCDLALAGGASGALPQRSGYIHEEGSILSPDGHCRVFDASAQGTVFGNGAGVVLLKRLEDAIADRDVIRAVIRGSAINNDGAMKVGFSAPSTSGQAEVIELAHALAEVDASTITYVEAHGTGTALGDPIEITALTKAFRASTQKKGFCAVGAIKANLGHLNAASGVAGFIKTVLALDHKQIPPSLHFEQPNPSIDFEDSPFYVSTRLAEWKTEGAPRRAGVSAFGMGGTNAHVVLEEAPARAAATSPERGAGILTLSAKDTGALATLVERYVAYLDSHGDVPLADICFTSNAGRAHFPHRIAVTASNHRELRERLELHRASSARLLPSRSESLEVAFLFSGRGASDPAMCRTLYESEPTFRRSLERCDAALKPRLGRSILPTALPAHLPTHLPTQERGAGSFGIVHDEMALFALEVALLELWRSWGVEPIAVLGSGIGEYVAAYAAGVLAFDDALKLALVRSRIVAEVSRLPDGARDPAAREAQAVLPLRAELVRAAQSTTLTEPRIALVSGATGQLVSCAALTHEYWLGQALAETVSDDAWTTLEELEIGACLELGPDPSLSASGRDRLPAWSGCWLASLVDGQPSCNSLLASLGELYIRGASIDWAGVHREHPRSRVLLPSYPFQRRRHWVAAQIEEQSGRSAAPDEDPLLGRKMRSPLLAETLFETEFRADHPRVLADHKIYGEVVVSGACFVAMFVRSVRAAFAKEDVAIEDVLFPEAMVLPGGEARVTQVFLGRRDEAGTPARILSFAADGGGAASAWKLHASAVVPERRAAPAAGAPTLAELRARCTEETGVERLFDALRRYEVQLGPSHRWVSAIWRGEGEVLCRMTAPSTVRDEAHHPHPGLVDSCFQTLAAIAPAEGSDTFVPYRIERLWTSGRPPGRELWCHAQLRGTSDIGNGGVVGDVRLFSADGELLEEFSGFESRRAPRQVLLRALRKSQTDPQEVRAQEIAWSLAAPASDVTAAARGAWLVLADERGVGAALCELLTARGDRCVLASRGASFEKLSEHRYRIDPSSPQDFRRLIGETLSRLDTPHVGVIHLWNVDAAPAGELSTASLTEAQELGCASALSLVQALAETEGHPTTRLYLVTSGACAVGPAAAPVQIAQAPLWGLGKVIAAEHPALKCTSVDLEYPLGSGSASELLGELAMTDEDQIARRNGQRYAPRLVESKALAGAAGPGVIRGDASYLITGGCGALGLQLAAWMAEQGARHLVLAGRSAPSAQAASAIGALERAGVNVLAVQVDIASQGDVTRLFEQIEASLPPLRGVVHAAGVLDDGILLNLDWKRFRAVLAPKVEGAWILHSVTRRLPLDFFVCFSSMSAVLGPPGQGSYAAANAFLDALAHDRRAAGLPATSINWGPWASAGMAAALSAQRARRLADAGFGAIEPAEGCGLFGQVMASDVTQLGLARVDWSRFLTRLPVGTRPSLLRSLEVGESGARPRRSSFLDELERTSAGERRARLQQHVHAQVAALLGVGAEETIAVDRSLFEHDFDSLLATDLLNRIEASLGVSLNATLLFRHPTIEALANHLADELFGAGSGPEPGRAEPRPGPTAAVPPPAAELEAVPVLDALSPEEVAELLSQKLDELKRQ